MPKDEIFQETVTRVEKPSSHFTLLRAPNGDFLGASDDGFAIFDLWTIRRYGTPSEKPTAMLPPVSSLRWKPLVLKMEATFVIKGSGSLVTARLGM